MNNFKESLTVKQNGIKIMEINMNLLSWGFLNHIFNLFCLLFIS